MRKEILFAVLAAILLVSTISVSIPFAEAKTMKVGGTIQSKTDPGIGHEMHQLAVILPPTVKIYKGTLYYYASEPLQLVTLKGPLASEDPSKVTWSTDGKTHYELIIKDGKISGKWDFEGNAIALHTTRPQTFTVSYTASYTEAGDVKPKPSMEEKKDDAKPKDSEKPKTELGGRAVNILHVFETSTPQTHTVIFQVCSGKSILRNPQVAISSDTVSRFVNLASQISADTCFKTATTVRAEDPKTIKVKIVENKNAVDKISALEKDMESIKSQLEELHKDLNSLSKDKESASKNKQKEIEISKQIRELREKLSELRIQYYQLLLEQYGKK